MEMVQELQNTGKQACFLFSHIATFLKCSHRSACLLGCKKTLSYLTPLHGFPDPVEDVTTTTLDTVDDTVDPALETLDDLLGNVFLCVLGKCRLSQLILEDKFSC